MTFTLNLSSHAYTALQPRLGTDLCWQIVPLLMRKTPGLCSSLMFINVPLLRMLWDEGLLISVLESFPEQLFMYKQPSYPYTAFESQMYFKGTRKGGSVSPEVEKQTHLCALLVQHKHYLTNTFFFSSPNYLNSVLLMLISSFMQHEIFDHDSELPENSGIKMNHQPARKSVLMC